MALSFISLFNNQDKKIDKQSVNSIFLTFKNRVIVMHNELYCYKNV